MSDTFRDYRQIVAKRSTPAGLTACGHAVRSGDIIGWNARLKRVRCQPCWDRWCRENEAADFDERVIGGGW